MYIDTSASNRVVVNAGHADTATTLNSLRPTLSIGNESNAITIQTMDNAELADLVGHLGAIRTGIDFPWYNTHWRIGNIRGGSTDSAGFGFSYSADGTTWTSCSYIGTDGTYMGLANQAACIKDAGDGRALYFNYSANAMTSCSWLAAWNGNILQSIAPGSLSVNYASTAGSFNSSRTIALTGAVTGSISSNGASGWNIDTAIKNHGISPTNFTSTFRTQTKGDSNSGSYFSVIRNDNTDSWGYMPIYGSGIAFGRYDTHTYLYTAYNDVIAYIGGGSGNNLKWVRRICFTSGEGASGTWGISINGSATKLTTARTLTIGASGKTFNGSADVSWSPYEMQLAHAYYGKDTSMNVIADRGSGLGMASLNSTSTLISPGGQTGWHHYINMTWSDCKDNSGSLTNEWCTQIANKCGTTDLWVRSRSGGSIADDTAWGAPWTRIVTGSNFTNVLNGTYINVTGDTMTGLLQMKPNGSSVEGGEIHLCASASANTVNGIILDNYNGTFRIFGIPSADGSTKTGNGTPLVIDPYAKTITGGYTITGTLNGSASSVAWANITGKPSTFTPSSHNHDAGNITSGTLPIARGGTGATSDYTAYHELFYRGAVSDANTCLKRGLYNFSTAATNIPGPANGTGSYGCIETIIANDIAEGVAIGGSTSSSWVWQLGWNTSYENMYIRRSVNAGAFTAWKKMWLEGDLITGAVWNDYAEYRETTTEIEPGRVVIENGNDTLSLCQERLMATAQVVSDTFGFAIGETDKAKTPLAVSGRVLVYTDAPRDTFQAGDTVCSGINGTVSKMTRKEIMMYPERIIGVVSAIPEYETWGTGNVKVNGRIWIKLT